MASGRPYPAEVDIGSDNPVGRSPDPRRPRSLTLELNPAGWRLGRSSGPWGRGLDGALAQLDTRHCLTVRGEAAESSRCDVARFLHRAMTRATHVSGLRDVGVRDALAPDLAAVVPHEEIEPAPGDLQWDVAAVEQRRAALRPLLGDLPSLSVVLVSRRPDMVESMVRQIAASSYPDIEIVVGMHGHPAPAGLPEAAAGRPLAVHQFDAGMIFGSVLDQAFALAQGRLVTKIDDDDYIGPDHFWDLVAAHRYSGATLVGKTTTVIYLEALDATVRRVYGTQEKFTHRVAGGTMLLAAAELSQLGGWPAVPRGVDTALLAAVKRAGGTVYQPHDIGYLYVRRSDTSEHTWSTEISHFLLNAHQQWIGLLEHPAFGTGHYDGGPS